MAGEPPPHPTAPRSGSAARTGLMLGVLVSAAVAYGGVAIFGEPLVLAHPEWFGPIAMIMSTIHDIRGPHPELRGFVALMVDPAHFLVGALCATAVFIKTHDAPLHRRWVSRLGAFAFFCGPAYVAGPPREALAPAWYAVPHYLTMHPPQLWQAALWGLGPSGVLFVALLMTLARVLNIAAASAESRARDGAA